MKSLLTDQQFDRIKFWLEFFRPKIENPETREHGYRLMKNDILTHLSVSKAKMSSIQMSELMEEYGNEIKIHDECIANEGEILAEPTDAYGRSIS